LETFDEDEEEEDNVWAEDVEADFESDVHVPCGCP
jgi:hypothetical protein